ncbi:hypothetical protein T492DRAFT_834943 [Pavlovales sp. CCMP2436]|nr:hypothetical protein T492DRAFT_834943 [Pavlovales sp. CCMP2436]
MAAPPWEAWEESGEIEPRLEPALRLVAQRVRRRARARALAVLRAHAVAAAAHSRSARPVSSRQLDAALRAWRSGSIERSRLSTDLASDRLFAQLFASSAGARALRAWRAAASRSVVSFALLSRALGLARTRGLRIWLRRAPPRPPRPAGRPAGTPLLLPTPPTAAPLRPPTVLNGGQDVFSGCQRAAMLSAVAAPRTPRLAAVTDQPRAFDKVHRDWVAATELGVQSVRLAALRWWRATAIRRLLAARRGRERPLREATEQWQLRCAALATCAVRADAERRAAADGLRAEAFLSWLAALPSVGFKTWASKHTAELDGAAADASAAAALGRLRDHSCSRSRRAEAAEAARGGAQAQALCTWAEGSAAELGARRLDALAAERAATLCCVHGLGALGAHAFLRARAAKLVRYWRSRAAPEARARALRALAWACAAGAIARAQHALAAERHAVGRARRALARWWRTTRAQRAAAERAGAATDAAAALRAAARVWLVRASQGAAAAARRELAARTAGTVDTGIALAALREAAAAGRARDGAETSAAAAASARRRTRALLRWRGGVAVRARASEAGDLAKGLAARRGRAVRTAALARWRACGNRASFAVRAGLVRLGGAPTRATLRLWAARAAASRSAALARASRRARATLRHWAARTAASRSAALAHASRHGLAHALSRWRQRGAGRALAVAYDAASAAVSSPRRADARDVRTPSPRGWLGSAASAVLTAVAAGGRTRVAAGAPSEPPPTPPAELRVRWAAVPPVHGARSPEPLGIARPPPRGALRCWRSAAARRAAASGLRVRADARFSIARQAAAAASAAASSGFLRMDGPCLSAWRAATAVARAVAAEQHACTTRSALRTLRVATALRALLAGASAAAAPCGPRGMLRGALAGWRAAAVGGALERGAAAALSAHRGWLALARSRAAARGRREALTRGRVQFESATLLAVLAALRAAAAETFRVALRALAADGVCARARATRALQEWRRGALTALRAAARSGRRRRGSSSRMAVRSAGPARPPLPLARALRRLARARAAGEQQAVAAGAARRRALRAALAAFARGAAGDTARARRDRVARARVRCRALRAWRRAAALRRRLIGAAAAGGARRARRALRLWGASARARHAHATAAASLAVAARAALRLAGVRRGAASASHAANAVLRGWRLAAVALGVARRTVSARAALARTAAVARAARSAVHALASRARSRCAAAGIAAAAATAALHRWARRAARRRRVAVETSEGARAGALRQWAAAAAAARGTRALGASWVRRWAVRAAAAAAARQWAAAACDAADEASAIAVQWRALSAFARHARSLARTTAVRELGEAGALAQAWGRVLVAAAAASTAGAAAVRRRLLAETVARARSLRSWRGRATAERSLVAAVRALRGRGSDACARVLSAWAVACAFRRGGARHRVWRAARRRWWADAPASAGVWAAVARAYGPLGARALAARYAAGALATARALKHWRGRAAAAPARSHARPPRARRLARGLEIWRALARAVHARRSRRAAAARCTGEAVVPGWWQAAAAARTPITAAARARPPLSGWASASPAAAPHARLSGAELRALALCAPLLARRAPSKTPVRALVELRGADTGGGAFASPLPAAGRFGARAYASLSAGV